MQVPNTGIKKGDIIYSSLAMFSNFDASITTVRDDAAKKQARNNQQSDYHLKNGSAGVQVKISIISISASGPVSELEGGHIICHILSCDLSNPFSDSPCRNKKSPCIADIS
jgi:hypothetical protein